MVLAIKVKAKHISLILLLVLLILTIFYLQAVKKDELIMTPSAHKQITFLETENTHLTSKYTVFFCLYDKECNYIQICISIPPKDRTLLQPNVMTFFVDDRKVPDYALTSYTTWNDSYVMIFLDNITEFQSIRCEYDKSVFVAFNK